VTVTRITYPAGHQYSDCSLSPGGDRLAWVMAKLPSTNAGPAGAFVRENLWGSRPDGSGMCALLPPGTDVPVWTFYCLSWTPDGRRLSFWHAGRLWTLPVEPAGSREPARGST
jgi:hypothetical protein